MHDGEDDSDLSLCEDGGSVTGNVSFEELDETGDGALLLPDGGCEKEGEEGAVFSGNVGGVKLEHLREDLEDVWNVFCKKRVC